MPREPESTPNPQEASGPGNTSLLSGRYLLGELLGSGGTSSVFRATDMVRGQTVALKVLHPRLSTNPESRDAFFAEALAVAELAHPNIVEVYAVGVHDAGGVEQAWIAEELVPGVNASELLEHGGSLPVGDALVVALGVASALVAAHAAGLVHRDISPGNVIVDYGEGGRIAVEGVRLIDFGLADAAGRSTRGETPLLAGGSAGGGVGAASRSAGIVGNVNYVSPEQARGEPVDERSDIYQAGALLYTLLTGQVPYPRAHAIDALAAHASAPPPVPSAERAGVPRAVDRIVVKAMATVPAGRYSSAAELAAEIAGATRIAGPVISPEGVTELMPAGVAGGHGVASITAATTVLSPDMAFGSRPAAGASGPGSSGAPSRSAAARRLGPRRITWGQVGSVAAVISIIALLAWGVIAYQFGDHASIMTLPSPSETLTASETAAPTPTPSPAARAAAPSPTPTTVHLVAVPPLTAVSLEAAGQALAAAGLTQGAVTPRDSTQAQNTVLDSNPAAGANISPGAPVDLIVASGNNAVPAVVGMSRTAAIAALAAAGFGVPNGVDAGAEAIVTSSAPAAGASIRLGTTIFLVYASPSASPTPSASPAPTPPAVTP